MSASTRASNYEFLKVISTGSLVSVELWRRKVQDEGLVVAKRLCLNEDLTKEEEKEARHEARILKQLEHPHIVKYVGSWLNKSVYELTIVQQYCEGGDLMKLIQKERESRGAFPATDVIRWLAQLAHALQYCHQRQRLLHRDLKPSNVFLSADHSQALLGDFGIAKALASTQHLANTFIGTQVYMSPEVLRMQSYGLKTDVWGLGTVLYEVCSLRRLFEPTDPLTLVKAMVEWEQPEPLPERACYPEELQLLCSAMLTKEVTKRPTLTQLLASSSLLRRAALDLERELQWKDTLVPPAGSDLKALIATDTPSSIDLEHPHKALARRATQRLPSVMEEDVEKYCDLKAAGQEQQSQPVGEAKKLGSLSAFAAAAKERIKVSSLGDSEANGSSSQESEGWGDQPPLPPSLSEAPQWRMQRGRPSLPSIPDSLRLLSGSNRGESACRDNVAGDLEASVHEAAKVRCLSELTFRKREFEEVIAQVVAGEGEEASALSQERNSDLGAASSPSLPPLPPVLEAQPIGCNGLPAMSDGQVVSTGGEDEPLQFESAFAMLDARLRCVKAIQQECPDPVELTEALHQMKEMDLGSEDCGRAVLAHAQRLRLQAEEMAVHPQSHLPAVEHAAEMLEALQHNTSGENTSLEAAGRRMQHQRGESNLIGLRCRCGQQVRLQTVKRSAPFSEVLISVANRWSRPAEGLSWNDGRTWHRLQTEDDWKQCLRDSPKDPIELSLPATKAKSAASLRPRGGGKRVTLAKSAKAVKR